MNDDMQAKLAALAEEHANHVWRMEPYGAESDSEKDFLHGANAAIELCRAEAAAREAGLVAALRRYATGNAIMVKPEKAHLYAQKFPESSRQWRERSMSDKDDTLLAKIALAEYDKREGML